MEELVFISDLLERLEESDTMGFLNRIKKQSEQEDSEKVRIKTTEEITNEQQSNEFDSLQSQINEKEIHLTSITEKLELTKKEYQDVISQVMSSKKKLLEIKKQVESAYSEFDLAPKQEEYQKILVEIKQSNNELLKIKKEIEDVNPQKLESQKINEEFEQRKKELEIIKKQLTNSKSKVKKDDSGSKQIVESASQVVATTNKKLEKALKELEMMKEILEKEKKSHNETKKKLDLKK